MESFEETPIVSYPIEHGLSFGVTRVRLSDLVISDAETGFSHSRFEGGKQVFVTVVTGREGGGQRKLVRRS